MAYRVVFGFSAWPAVRRGLYVAAWVAAGGALVAAAFAFSFLTAMRMSMESTQVEVPALTGLDLDQARESVAPAGLVIQVVDERYDPRLSSGRVLGQVPPEGAAVRRGRKVKVILSLGGKVIEVPDLIGQASRAVAIELRQVGLLPGDEARIWSGTGPPGHVLAQVPHPATSAVPNSRVHRLVSDGPASLAWVMPDLRGRTRSQAESWISGHGFRRGVVRTVRGTGRLPGTVVSQYPQSGYPIRAREIIELAVAQ